VSAEILVSKGIWSRRLEITKGFRPLETLLMIEARLAEGTWNRQAVLFWSFWDCSPANFQEARYKSWLNAPEVMRYAMQRDRYNFVLQGHKSATLFAEAHPKDIYQQWEDAPVNSYDHRYLRWLERVRPREFTVNEKLVGGRVIRIARSRRAEKHPLLHAMGLDSVGRALDKVGSSLKSFFYTESNPEQVECRDLIIVSEAFGDYTREEKLMAMSFGMQPWEIPFSERVLSKVCLAPMSAMEYKNITRPIQPFKVETAPAAKPPPATMEFSEAMLGSFTAEAEQVAESSYERMIANRHQPILGGLVAIGDAYELDEKSGIILPNFNSPRLSVIIERVSR